MDEKQFGRASITILGYLDKMTEGQVAKMAGMVFSCTDASRDTVKAFLDELSSGEREEFASQVESIDREDE